MIIIDELALIIIIKNVTLRRQLFHLNLICETKNTSYRTKERKITPN